MDDLNSLAELDWEQGRLGGVEPTYRRVLNLSRLTHSGEEHPDVATSMTDLAQIDRDQGRYDGAGSLFDRAAELRRDLFGEKQADVVDSLNNRSAQVQPGRFVRGRTIVEGDVGLARPDFGPDHPRGQTIRYNLGVIEVAKGEANGRYDGEATEVH